MGMEPCDVGPVCSGSPAYLYQSDTIRVEGDGSVWEQGPVGTWTQRVKGDGRQRHHPNGIEPPDDTREQRRAAERDLMEQYRNPAACRVLHGKPIEGDITPHVEAGETFARLIKG